MFILRLIYTNIFKQNVFLFFLVYLKQDSYSIYYFIRLSVLKPTSYKPNNVFF